MRAGEQQRLLLSIPAPQLTAEASFATDDKGLRVTPQWRSKSLQSFRLAWREFSRDEPSGLLTMRSAIPIARGLGSSTADCAAAMRAAANCFGATLEPEHIADLAHRVERYSDSTIFTNELAIFRHDVGKVFERLPGAAPRLQLLLIEDPSATGVVTEEMTRPIYNDGELRLFDIALKELRRAARRADAQAFASVAELSAEINQRHAPKPQRSELLKLTRAAGALGLGCAHSGDMQVMIFADIDSSSARISWTEERLQNLGLRSAGVLRTCIDSVKPAPH